MSAANYDNLIAGQALSPRNPGGVRTARRRTDERKKNDTPACSHVSVITSSQELGWQDISVSHVRSNTKDCPQYYAAASPNHRVIVHLGSPLHITRKIGGRVDRKYVTRGAVTVTPAGEEAEWLFEGEEVQELLIISLSPAFVRRVSTEADLEPGKAKIVNALGIHDARIEQIGLALLEELANEDLAGRLYAESLAKVLALDLLRRYSTLGQLSGEVSGGLTPRKLKRAIEHIGHNLAGDLSLINIADATGINAYHFSHLFKQSTGLAPHQYVIKVRVEEAKRLLTETDLSICEIAQRVGYTHSRFSALFRRHTGTTPTAYRDAQE